MKVGFVILCRYNSSRLPGKILKKIDQKPILYHVVSQLEAVVGKSAVMVATSEATTDDKIAEYCDENEISIFRGSLDNVSERFLSAAQKMDVDFVFRINGDNLFINQELISEMIKLALTDEYDFLSNVPGRSWGFGMSIECVRTSFYEKVFEQYKTPDDFEHVTLYLYQNENIGRRKYFVNEAYPHLKNKQLAIDTEDDLENLTLLYGQVKIKLKSSEQMVSILNDLLKETNL